MSVEQCEECGKDVTNDRQIILCEDCYACLGGDKNQITMDWLAEIKRVRKEAEEAGAAQMAEVILQLKYDEGSPGGLIGNYMQLWRKQRGK